MSLEADIADLRGRLELARRTLVLIVVPSDAELEEVKRPLLAILRATPLAVADLGACTSSTGPARWAELARAQPQAAVHVLSFVPPTALAARAFANLLNAERGLLSEQPGPLLLMVSRETELVLRRDAHDFVTWISHPYALPRARELMALAGTLGVVPVEPAAPAETPIRFLHVSDFHLRPTRVARYEQDRVLEGLLQFLARDREASPLDLVFVTGDLAWSGRADEYALVVAFLRELLEVTGVPPEHLFIVPGNHDVDRSVGKWLLRTLADDAEAIEFFEEPNGRMFHRRKLEAYETSLRALVGPGRSLGLEVGADAVEVIEVRGTTLAVASLNSAWFSQGDGDQGKLWIGDPNVKRAYDRIGETNAAFAISLLHHPFDYLHEDDRRSVEAWLERGFDLVLRGHLHENKTRNIASQRGGYVEVAAPAAYQGSHWPNGCFLGEIRAEARTVRLRPYTFAAGPDPWVLDTKVFPDDADDGYCHTFTVARRAHRKSALSTATHEVLQDAWESFTPNEQMIVKKQVLHDRPTHDPPADHQVLSQIAAEPPELIKSIFSKDHGVALVGALATSLAKGPSSPRIDVTEAAGFERALLQAGRLFLGHTAQLGLPRGRMSERDAVNGVLASLESVVAAPIAMRRLMRKVGPPARIVIDGKDVIEVARAAEQGPEHGRLVHYADADDVRHAALAVVGVLPEGAADPIIERITTPAGRMAWIVRL